VKFDGYRMQVRKAGPTVTLYTRNGHDWTERFPHLTASLASLACDSATIDTELMHADGFGEGLLLECGARGLGGVIAKHKGSVYRSGRSTSWIKVKCRVWVEANRNRGEPVRRRQVICPRPLELPMILRSWTKPESFLRWGGFNGPRTFPRAKTDGRCVKGGARRRSAPAQESG
jgi:ATP dependent DNA ligase domain